MRLLVVAALLTLTGCSALICSPWDPRCEVNKDCSVNTCKVCIEKIECTESIRRNK